MMKKSESYAVPTFSVVGYSKAGKTTYLEKLIPSLKEKGLRIGVVKHDAHAFEIDIPGKDSWRLTRAGADLLMLSSPEKLALIEHWTEEEKLPELSQRFQGKVDLILTEGFKQSTALKIEIRRLAAGHPALYPPEALFAVASDGAPPHAFPIPWLSLEDTRTMADLIVERRNLYATVFGSGH